MFIMLFLHLIVQNIMSILMSILMALRQAIQLAVASFCSEIVYIVLFRNCLPASFFVFSAESIVIETGLKLISSYSHKRFIIYTDSRSVLDSLHSNSYSPSFISVLKLYNKLYNKGFPFYFVGFLHMWALKATELLIKLKTSMYNIRFSSSLF